MNYDCFFSYQHEDLGLVESIVNELEKKGLECWYAPRNVKGRYAKAIADGISSAKVFVLILNHRSAVSEAVLNEVELAHNVSKSGPNAIIQPIIAEELDLNKDDYQEMMYYIRRKHFIDARKTTEPSEIADAIIKANDILGKKEQRTKSEYVVQDIEDKRLSLQNELLKNFDGDVYQRILNQYKELNILDVGCGQGDMLISKLEGHSVKSFVGVDKSSRQIKEATLKYANDIFGFLECDIESADFGENLKRYIASGGIKGFEVINISMVLLHLNNPCCLLKTLAQFLTDDGTIIIRDIDDGINFAFPDYENAFDRIYQMCARDEQSGNRKNGRQVYTALCDAGYSEVKLERQGLSSIGMSIEEKETLFNMYFPFTLENAKIMMEKYSWNQDYKKDYLWYAEQYEELHRKFLEPNFIFSLGFMTYTAHKQKKM